MQSVVADVLNLLIFKLICFLYLTIFHKYPIPIKPKVAVETEAFF